MSTSEIQYKETLKKNREMRLVEDAFGRDKVSYNLIQIYIGILKYGYKPRCSQSLLSPEVYVVELDQIGNETFTLYTRHHIKLCPCSKKNVRF